MTPQDIALAQVGDRPEPAIETAGEQSGEPASQSKATAPNRRGSASRKAAIGSTPVPAISASQPTMASRARGSSIGSHTAASRGVIHGYQKGSSSAFIALHLQIRRLGQVVECCRQASATAESDNAEMQGQL